MKSLAITFSLKFEIYNAPTFEFNVEQFVKLFQVICAFKLSYPSTLKAAEYSELSESIFVNSQLEIETEAFPIYISK